MVVVAADIDEPDRKETLVRVLTVPGHEEPCKVFVSLRAQVLWVRKQSRKVHSRVLNAPLNNGVIDKHLFIRLDTKYNTVVSTIVYRERSCRYTQGG